MAETENDTAKNDEGKGPEFDGDFDAERAKRLIANLRGEITSLKDKHDAVAIERDDFKKAAEQTGEGRDKALQAALDRAAVAERTLAIKKHNLPDDVVEEFSDYLTGTAEEVEAKAAKLAARLTPAAPVDDKGDEPKVDDAKGDDKGDLPGRPEADLKPGHGGTDAVAFDPVAIAQAARR